MPARFLLALILTVCIVLQTDGLNAETAPAPPPLTLRSLRIKGAKIIPAKKVRKELSIPLPSRWPWKKAPVFVPQDLESDLESLKMFYRRQGFYHTQIESDIQKDEKGRVRVVLTIKEGPWIVVKSITIKVTDPAIKLDLSKLKEKWPLTIGDRFTDDTYENLKKLYLTYFYDNGYPRATIEGKVYLNDQVNTANIGLTITPKTLSYFGEVRLKGRPRTPEFLIRRKLTFKKGEIFSLKKLYESQRQLYALNLFKSVILTPEEVPATERNIPITIEVVESKKRSLRVGLGYGDEDQFRGKLGLRLRNLFGGGRLLDVDGKYSSLETRFMGSFLNPQIWKSYWDLSLQSGLIELDRPGFDNRAFFTRTRFERDLPWRIRIYLGHGLGIDRPFNVPTQSLILLRERPGKTFTSSMFQVGLRQDQTDNLVDPTQGWILFANGDLATDFLGSNLQFGRAVLGASKYQSLGKTGVVLAGRLKFGIIRPIQGTKNIPIQRRFFAGGGDSVRGYRLDRLGPRNLSGEPVGGEALLEGSFETRIPIYKEFRGVGFLDFGNVFFKSQDINLGQLKYSAGFGFRYSTPVGPIGVDVGFPLNPINPRQDPSVRVHLTVGQAF